MTNIIHASIKLYTLSCFTIYYNSQKLTSEKKIIRENFFKEKFTVIIVYNNGPSYILLYLILVLLG